MSQQIDYEQIAGVYAQTRAAVPWVLEAVAEQIEPFRAGALIIEVGCGTGNHIRALADRYPQHQYEGFDQSYEMLREAESTPSRVIFRQADAQLYWPYTDNYANLVFGVDMIHYIQDLPIFFREARRTLKNGGKFLIVTDAESDLRERSLTRFFPEILEYEVARYPTAEKLQEAAANAGLTYGGVERIRGTQTITDSQIGNLAAKCSSALRLITPEAHAAGLTRVRQAQAAGEEWASLYTIYQYVK